MQIGVRIEESWCSSWPYRWLADRSVRKGRRELIHRESFRASVLHLSEIQTVLQSIAEKNCLLTTPSLLSKATQEVSTALRTGRPPFRLSRCDWPDKMADVPIKVSKMIIGGTRIVQA